MKKYIICLLMLISSTMVYADREQAIFAGGCFWCLQADFDKLSGIISTQVGYDGGKLANPTYSSVSKGLTNYAESVQVIFDNQEISYQQLLDYFWRHIDPTTKDRQFCDVGRQYRTAIFYLNNRQNKLAQASLATVKKRFPNVYTEITPSTKFYPAEDYHQKYYQKNALKYRYYRWNCGRDSRIQELWHETT